MRHNRLGRRAWLGLLAPAAVGLWFYCTRVDANDLSNIGVWSPTRDEIAAAVGPAAGGSSSEAQRLVFADLFQRRFRTHQLAIGIRLLPGRRAKLMCAAYMPRWHMARAAIALDEDTRDVLGTSYDIDIYETYIGLRRLKVGELRRDRSTGRARIVFDPPYPVSVDDLPPHVRARMSTEQSSTEGMLAPGVLPARPRARRGADPPPSGLVGTGQPWAVPMAVRLTPAP